MTVQITGADKRFTDMSGRFYAGMTLDEVEGNDKDKEKNIIDFNKIDEDKDGVLSYEEMFEDLKEDRGTMEPLKKQGFRVGIAGILCGIITKKHLASLAVAGIGLLELIYSKINIDKIDQKHAEWKKLYSEMETAQNQKAA